ncbi:hypothetical protein Egran_00368 [Elaphomyces granulatus]|uniref:C2H2-type domain-containing protein n=1 Tax=Elaphomyces granulatus TaxID=519963 RepID=A0A232M650_9EURO|nr:hypothetical protein Egran_00368 [Elaphomyces granulatus]
MGKKKRGHPDLEELLARPWCYYCERDFDDLKILISHQKAKHFKCERCGRRLNTAGGKSPFTYCCLTAVDNALPNRSSLDIEIFGMEGVPEDIIQAHNQRVLTQFQQAEAERRAATGNPPPGASQGGNQLKKPKLESAEELKKRLAEHKAKMATEQTAGDSSGEVTPVGVGQTLQTASGYNQSSQFPTTQPPFNNATAPNQQFPYQQQYGGISSPYQQAPSPVYQNFSSNGQQQLPASQYTSPGLTTQQFPAATPGQAPAYGSTPPPIPFAQQQQLPARTHTPPQASSLFPPRPGNLPAAPSLPQRPSFGAPQVNPHLLQQIHHAHLPIAAGAISSTHGPILSGENALIVETVTHPLAASVDDLISGAAKEADNAAARAASAPKPEETPEEKPTKKEKSKPTKLVYSDNEISPEEKMARLPRYAFVPDRKGETALGEAITAAVS